jgi:chromosome segregation ATPase
MPRILDEILIRGDDADTLRGAHVVWKDEAGVLGMAEPLGLTKDGREVARLNDVLGEALASALKTIDALSAKLDVASHAAADMTQARDAAQADLAALQSLADQALMAFQEHQSGWAAERQNLLEQIATLRNQQRDAIPTLMAQIEDIRSRLPNNRKASTP